MKTLIVFYSRTQTTKKVAQEIASKMGADTEEIISPDIKLGFFNFLRAGRDGFAKKTVKIENIKSNPADYDLVIIGTPVWAGNMSSPIRTYISQNKNKFKKAAFFCTCGDKQSNTFSNMQEAVAKEPVATLVLKAKSTKNDEHKKEVAQFIGKLT